jgi:hypothetical protein
MTPTQTILDPAIFPADVVAFAAERGVTDYLVPLYELAKQCFPGAEVTVRHESDGDLAGLAWIVFVVAAGHWPDGPRRAGRRRWTAEKLRALPPAACESFALGVR